MNSQRAIILGLILSACTGTPKQEQVANVDTVAQQIEQPTISTVETAEVKAPIISGEYLVEDTIVVIGMPTLLSIPDIFAFSVNSEKENFVNLLGKTAKYREENFPGGEDFEPYTVSYLTFGETELMEYSYGGMHSAYIDTPLLSLKEGIKVGMTKDEFLQKFKLPALSENIFVIRDEYGSVTFNFLKGTLKSISFYYEYGD
jgi:hypothetical protein